MNTAICILWTLARAKQSRLRVVTCSKDSYVDAMTCRVSKRLTKRVIGQIAKKSSGELPSGFAREVLETISVAENIRTFDNCITLTKTWRQHKEHFASLL